MEPTPNLEGIEETRERRHIAWGVVGLCLFAIMLYKGVKNNPPEALLRVMPEVAVVQPPPAPPKEDPFKDIFLKAKSAYVLDLSSQTVLFERNSKQQLPLASLTKIMTAIVAGKLVPKDTKITISRQDLKQEGDNGLLLGEKWKLDDLIRFTLLVSSNDGAHALASALASVKGTTTPVTRTDFIAYMNEYAKKIGLEKTRFVNETGLDEDNGVSGGYGSAEDVAKLFIFAKENYPEVFDITKEKSHAFMSDDNVVHEGTNTNKIIETIPGIMASKTGLTDLAGGNLAVEFMPQENHPVVIVVMGSSTQGRFDDMDALVKATEKYFASN